MTERMTGAARIEAAIRAATTAGRPALAAFLTAGFPERESFAELLDAVAAEADLVEIGVPFSDPMADGITIQRSSRAALEAGVTLEWILEVTAGVRRETPLLLMSYLNPLLAFTLPRLADTGPAARISGVIVPDLPYEECAPIRDVLDGAGVALVQLVTPLTPEERLATLCTASRGFVYAVTRTGTTGAAADDLEILRAYLDRVRGVASLPVLTGFGIRSADQVASLRRHADGVIVGSALVALVERRGDPAAFLRQLRQEAAP